jgi:hypothetical protein
MYSKKKKTSVSNDELDTIFKSKLTSKVLSKDSKEINFTKSNGNYMSAKIDKNTLPANKYNKLLKNKQEKEQKQRSPFVSKKHEQYCSTGNVSLLEKPVLKTISWMFIPFKSLSYYNNLSLDKKEPVFEYQKPNDYDIDLNIYNNYNNFNKTFLKNMSIQNELLMHFPWFKKQQEYITNLPLRLLYTLRGYTYVGDVLANNTLRGSLDTSKIHEIGHEFASNKQHYLPVFFQVDECLLNAKSYNDVFKSSKDKNVRLLNLPGGGKLPHKKSCGDWFVFYKEQQHKLKNSEKYVIIISLWEHMLIEFIQKTIDMFIVDMKNIFKNAPPLTKEMTVYRGVKDDFYLKGAKNGIYKNNGFISTAIDVNVAEMFRNGEDKIRSDLGCCLKRITLVPGTRVVTLMPVSPFGEKEILLNDGSLYLIKKERVIKTLYNEPSNASRSLCYKKTHKVIVSDITLTS